MHNKLYQVIICVTIAVITMTAFHSTAQNNNKTMNKISAIELYNAFRSNDAAALKAYEMKTMLITGVAVKVGPDVYGLPSVEVASKNGESCKALCVLPFTDYFKLRHVSKKDNVVIQGEIRGYSDEYDLVVVKQCKIISVNEKNL